MAIVKKKLKIEGMHCTSCAMTIDMDLEDLVGVESSDTSYAKEITEVKFEEEKVNMDDIVQVIEKSGYKAIPLET
ncbi:MAG: heavy-metal-associated domain-containing protein [Candidatus Daviesbacteria bacterium]|nr:heavy-metal-associated domain-containing protein [Candidatus Daviesbacteria bacterium]